VLGSVARSAMWVKSAISAVGALAKRRVAPQRGLQQILRQVLQALRSSDFYRFHVNKSAKRKASKRLRCRCCCSDGRCCRP
jgi:hypothetical protein